MARYSKNDRRREWKYIRAQKIGFKKKKEETLEDSEKRKEDKIRKQKEENERKRKEKQRETAKISASESTTNSSEDAMDLDGIGTSTSTAAAIQKKRTSNGGLGPSIYTEMIEKKRQQFKTLFKETGIVDIISQVLNALYQEKEWPKNPKDFISRHFSTILNGGKDPEQLCQELRQENERMRLENAEMEDISTGLTSQLPPVFDSDISMEEKEEKDENEEENEEEPPAIEPPAPDPVPKASTPKTPTAIPSEIQKVIPKPASPKPATTKLVSPTTVPASVFTETPDPAPIPAPAPAPVPAKPVDLSNPETMTWADMQRMMEEDRAKEAVEQKPPPKKAAKKKEETPEELEKKERIRRETKETERRC